MSPESRDSDPALSAVFAQSPSTGQGGPCPSSEEICRIAFGDTSKDELRGLALHVIHCRDCRLEWSVARDLYLQSQAGATQAAPKHRLLADGRGASKGLGWASLLRFPRAAALWQELSRYKHRISCAALASGAAMVMVLRQGAPLLSAWTEGPVYRTLRSHSEEPGAFLDASKFKRSGSGASLRFAWPSAGRACTYVVSFFDANLSPLASSRVLKAPHFEPSGKVLEALEGQREIVWEVSAGGDCPAKRSPMIRLDAAPSNL